MAYYLVNKESLEYQLLTDFVFPFSIDDVACVYTYHLKRGRGNWFKLKDGSLWNGVGYQEQDVHCSHFI